MFHLPSVALQIAAHCVEKYCKRWQKDQNHRQPIKVSNNNSTITSIIPIYHHYHYCDIFFFSRSRLLVFLIIGLAITYMLPRWEKRKDVVKVDSVFTRQQNHKSGCLTALTRQPCWMMGRGRFAWSTSPTGSPGSLGPTSSPSGGSAASSSSSCPASPWSSSTSSSSPPWGERSREDGGWPSTRRSRWRRRGWRGRTRWPGRGKSFSLKPWQES